MEFLRYSTIHGDPRLVVVASGTGCSRSPVRLGMCHYRSRVHLGFLHSLAVRSFFPSCLTVGGCGGDGSEGSVGSGGYPLEHIVQVEHPAISLRQSQQRRFIGMYGGQQAHAQHHAAVLFPAFRVRRVDTRLQTLSTGNLGFPPGGLAYVRFGH